jgi:hypothetical protein
VSDRLAITEPDLKKLSSWTILTPIYHNTKTITGETAAHGVEILGGMYNLKLLANEDRKSTRLNSSHSGSI